MVGVGLAPDRSICPGNGRASGCPAPGALAPALAAGPRRPRRASTWALVGQKRALKCVRTSCPACSSLAKAPAIRAVECPRGPAGRRGIAASIRRGRAVRGTWVGVEPCREKETGCEEDKSRKGVVPRRGDKPVWVSAAMHSIKKRKHPRAQHSESKRQFDFDWRQTRCPSLHVVCDPQK